MRLIKIDNYKVLLTFFVVLGHVIGFMGFRNAVYPQNVIYAFHMPAFILINGVLFKWLNYQKFLKLLGVFIVMQLFYLFYFRMAGYYTGPFNLLEKMQIPAYHLWYLVAYLAWALLIFLLILIKKYLGNVVWIITLILISVSAFAIRFLDLGIPDQWMTYTRILVFAPFFIIGFYAKDWFKNIVVTPRVQMAAGISLLGSIVSVVWLTSMNLLPTSLFWGFSHLKSLPYETITFVWIEGYQFMLACVMLVAVYVLVPTKTYSWTKMSKNVTAIYLWHPAIAVWLLQVDFQGYSGKYTFVLALIFTGIIMFVLNRLFTNPTTTNTNKS